MRPAGTVGEVRSAILDCLREQPATLVDVVQRANVSYDAARRTIDNCKRAGQVRVADRRHMPHSSRPVAVYECADVLDDLPAAGDWRGLSDAMSDWAR